MKRKTVDVIVFGGGPAGCMAALMAARKGAAVLILEQKEKLLKKLYATGNGKCNFTNEDMDPAFFRGDGELVRTVLGKFGLADTLAFFRELGIVPKNRNGYYYPNSRTAVSVVRALCEALREAGVEAVCGFEAAAAGAVPQGFRVTGRIGGEGQSVSYTARALVFATGLLASPQLGSDGSALSLIKSMGHGFTPLVPALCALKAKGLPFSRIAGVRTEAEVALLIDGKPAARDTGELQLTDYGISGIPVFQVSRYAGMGLYGKREVTACLDFFPGMSAEALGEELSGRVRFAGRTHVDAMLGLLPEKLTEVLLAQAGLAPAGICGPKSREQYRGLARRWKSLPLAVTDTAGFSHAQVCAGGLRHDQIEPQTLESRLAEGLFFAGELLDADGICGGYNLQWAWSSGYVAGLHAAERTIKRKRG